MRIIIITLGLLVIGVVYFLFDPSKGYLPECPFYHLTHLYCPGCGSQRGLHALLHGDIRAALGFNPLMILGLIYIAIEAGIWIINRRNVHISSLASRKHAPIIALIVVMLYWILRNIPFAPFTLLAP